MAVPLTYYGNGGLCWLDPQNKTGVQMAQGSRNNLMKASIRKGKEVTVTQNIVTRFVITLS